MADETTSDEIAQIEARLEELAGIAERCRKIILAAKAAIGFGVAVLLAAMFGAFVSIEFALSAIAAVLGGIVALGSNVSTLQQTTDAMAAAEALRAGLIDGIDLRVVSGRARLGWE